VIDFDEPVLSARELSLRAADGTALLDRVSVELHAGEVVVIMGPSGAGKTLLLDTLAGVRAGSSGSVELRMPTADGGRPSVVGYVPQDDIVHLDLPVESTLRYAARLRLGHATSSEIDAAVERTLDALGLTGVGRQTVASLSGGQRKRASIGSELVGRPTVCLLDEPTSGLDPTAASELMHVLRALADHGAAIALTSHHADDALLADRVVVVAPGGRIAFDGTPARALDHFGVDDLRAISAVLAVRPFAPPALDEGRRRSRHRRARPRQRPAPARAARTSSSSRQLLTLARRNGDLALRNRMSLAIMAGSPFLVVAMFLVLFEPHSFATSPATTGVAMTYWLAFAGFFFGLTFGLLQICTELPILRRERLSTIDLGPYLAAKCVVLVPALVAVDIVMVATLTSLDRLPRLGTSGTIELTAALVADSVAGLALGLLASASVTTAAQAALALPMLCFPAVLFSGAVVPAQAMTGAGRAIAAFVSTRWGFDAVARALELDAALGHTAAGRELLAQHGGAFAGSPTTPIVVVCVLALVFLVAARGVVGARSLSNRSLSSRGTARPRR
jgi:ABC-type multidrug transport system ATPase subunit